MVKKKIKILITSVGSLVGQNIIDVLEYKDFFRRNLVTLIGANSLAASPNNFRCDKCYLLPETSTNEFKDKTINIIKQECPDLILSGRDEDTELVAKLMKDNPHLPGKLPYGEIHTLTFALDKLETWNFCKKYNLPFAETLKAGSSEESIQKFVEKNGFPLIAKPMRGFASKGVFFVKNQKDLDSISNYKNYLLQEYLGDSNLLSEYFNKMTGPTPLFVHAPNIYHHSCHLIIAPDGKLSPIFISRNDHNSGVTVGFKKVEKKDLEELTKSFAKSIYSEGGYGPLTIQFRLSKNNEWKAQEINFRTNGNTFPRFIMGQDDIGLIISSVLPEFDFPVYYAPLKNKSFIIGKTLLSNVMLPEQIEKLEVNGEWSLNKA